MRETIIDGVQLRFYVHQHATHRGQLVSEWLLAEARKLDLGGGTVFRASAGFGRHGVVHHETFFELADDLPLKVEFLLTKLEAEALLDVVRKADVELVYAHVPTRFGVLAKE